MSEAPGGGREVWGGCFLERVGIYCSLIINLGSLVSQRVKNMPAMQETQVRSLGQEDPLEKGMTTHSSILAWRIPWTEERGVLQPMGLQIVRHN